MHKIYHLSSCNTCQRIIKELELPLGFKLQDIKSSPITEPQLSHLKELAGDYKSLFSRRARLYNQRNLKEQPLTESDYKELILEHYTFLKRPIILIENNIFIGNSKKTIEAAKKAIHLR